MEPAQISSMFLDATENRLTSGILRTLFGDLEAGEPPPINPNDETKNQDNKDIAAD